MDSLFDVRRDARESGDSCPTFVASDFAGPVAGTVFGADRPPTQGMPLGGIGTGCVDLAADGTLGFCTIFNSHVPRRGPVNLPILGVSAGGEVYVLSTRSFASFDMPGQHGYRTAGEVRFAEDVAYWGHYPMVDVEYATSAPLAVRLRAWSPFVPGDLTDSAVPAAVFEVTLENRTAERVEGATVFSFPGPTDAEAGGPAQHEPVSPGDVGQRVAGVRVRCASGDYLVAVLDADEVTHGGCLGTDGAAWRRFPLALPTPAWTTGASVSARYALEPGESTTVSYLLAWHFPEWRAAGNPDPAVLAATHGYLASASSDEWLAAQDDNSFRHTYADRFADSVEVARHLAGRRADLRRRIIAWQQVLYAEPDLPGWLADGLINSLHLITETAFWASARSPIGSWCRPEDGLFGMNEDPRNCPQIECVPCSFYGNYPLVYFFPQLVLSTLRGYRAYQYDDGEVAWIFGGITANPPTYPTELTRPDRGYQTALNGSCVVDMVFRYWKRTGDDDVLREMYDMVKRATVFTMCLRAEDGPAGVISFPAGESGLEWFEACTWAGMATHLGGIHLAQLRQVQVMAERLGDTGFAERCREWFVGGSAAMEDLMWTGSHYLNYWDRATGERSDLVMANQLDGQWMALLGGLPDVFAPERIPVVLDTIERTCVQGHPYGAVNFADVTGRATTSGEGRPGWNYNPHAYFVPENIMLAASFLYAGRRERGMEIAWRCWANLTEHGLTWDQPNLLNAATGEAIYGNDYYQNMIIWTLPAAIQGQDVAGPTRIGGLVDRIIAAGAATTDNQHAPMFTGAGGQQ